MLRVFNVYNHIGKQDVCTAEDQNLFDIYEEAEWLDFLSLYFVSY